MLAGDWNCAQTSGVYTRNQDCIMSSQVTLGGSLSVTGGTQLTWEELEGGGGAGDDHSGVGFAAFFSGKRLIYADVEVAQVDRGKCRS